MKGCFRVAYFIFSQQRQLKLPHRQHATCVVCCCSCGFCCCCYYCWLQLLSLSVHKSCEISHFAHFRFVLTSVTYAHMKNNRLQQAYLFVFLLANVVAAVAAAVVVVAVGVATWSGKCLLLLSLGLLWAFAY